MSKKLTKVIKAKLSYEERLELLRSIELVSAFFHERIDHINKCTFRQVLELYATNDVCEKFIGRFTDTELNLVVDYYNS